jgi:hypothetical protein
MPAFDVVCRVDLQEVDNAVQQALREIGQRFDFKGSRTELRREDTALHLASADEFKVRALGDILRERLARRQVPLKALLAGRSSPGRPAPRSSGSSSSRASRRTRRARW